MNTVIPKHLPALDGLRGVAILMVLMVHVADAWPGALSIYAGDHVGAPTFDLPQWLRTIVDQGGNGVGLFFAVSAFTLTLRASGDRGGLAAYVLRRIARVGPGYWIAGLGYTALTGTASRLWAPTGITGGNLIVAALFGSAWAGDASLAVVPGGWSVACEVTFYLALPVLLRLIDGRIWRSLALTALALLIAQIRARHAMVDGTYGFAFEANPIEQAPIFLCGVTAAMIVLRGRVPRWPGAATALVALGIVGLPLAPVPHYYVLTQLLFALIVAAAVAFAATNPPWLLANRLMHAIGEVSYSMYLVHFVVLAGSLHVAAWLAPGMGSATFVLHLALTVVVSFCVASVTWRTIERPAIRWAARRRPVLARAAR